MLLGFICLMIDRSRAINILENYIFYTSFSFRQLSKYETLQMALSYIQELDRILKRPLPVSTEQTTFEDKTCEEADSCDEETSLL